MELIGDTAKVTRPIARGDLKFYNLDDSITTSELAGYISDFGKCMLNQIRVGELKTQKNGLYVCWVNCPLAVAINLAKQEKIKMGWSVIGVELMKARPLKCFKCWHYGHLMNKCNNFDRSGKCFKCGRGGHNYSNCNNPFFCCICSDLGFSTDHRMGSSYCKANRNYQAGISNNNLNKSLSGRRTENAFDN